MENTVKIGDVWWNKKHEYGKVYIQVETSMPTVAAPYLLHSRSGNKGSDCMWASGGLEQTGGKLSDEWVFLYNIQDVATISLEAIYAEYRTRP